MTSTRDAAQRQATWEVFFDAVQADYLWMFRDRVMPLPSWEDHGHPGIRAMQRGRRFAWMHARHVVGLSMFEAIRLSQRLAEVFMEWTRSAGSGVEELKEALRRTEEVTRQVEPIRMRMEFVEALDEMTRRDGSRSVWEVGLKAYQEVARRHGTRS